MKEFVAYIVKNLVDRPEKVLINEIGGTQTLIIELSVEKSDIGKIIGKKGKTINAIRTLLMSVASRNGMRVNLEILEDPSKSAANRETIEDLEAEAEVGEQQEEEEHGHEPATAGAHSED
jgi:predicted RNA-binding protein YlqC (UPF0109 family)